MYIFLSYARTQHDLADELSQRLRGEGHEVFFDRDDLPPGETFDAQIRKGVRRADAAIFLASEHAIRDGAYALTELQFLRERWPHPRGRVISVVCDSVPIDKLPPYLRGVGVLQPAGDTVAEVLAQVDRLVRRRRARVRVWAGAAGAAIAGALGVFGWISRDPPIDIEGLTIDAIEMTRLEQGFLGSGDRYRASAHFTNTRQDATFLRELEVQLDSDSLGVMVDSALEDGAPITLAPGESTSIAIDFRVIDWASADYLVEAELPRLPWRLAWRRRDAPQWTPWQALDLAGAARPAAARRVEGDVSSRIQHLTADGRGFIAALRSPAAIVRLDDRGIPARPETPIDGRIRAIAASGNKVAIATAAPDAAVVLDGERFEALWRRTIEFANPDPDAPLATRPRSIAVTEEGVWVVTHDEEDWPTLLQILGANGTIRISYENDDSFDPDGLDLSVVGGQLYAVAQNVWPGRILRLEPDRYTEWGGHDYDFLGSAYALVDATNPPTGAIRLLSPRNELLTVTTSGDQPELIATMPSDAPNETELGTAWEDDRLLSALGQTFAFHSTTDVTDDSAVRLRVSVFTADGQQRTILRSPFSRAIAAAGTEGALLFVVEDFYSKRHLFRIDAASLDAALRPDIVAGSDR